MKKEEKIRKNGLFTKYPDQTSHTYCGDYG